MTIKNIKVPDLLKGGGLIVTVFLSGYWVTQTLQLKVDAKEDVASLQKQIDSQKENQKEINQQVWKKLEKIDDKIDQILERLPKQ